MSYHNGSVPGLSTIEMSPGFSFTMPRKRLEFSFAASLVAKGDVRLGCVDALRDGGAGEGAEWSAPLG
jgi:hypothetical protein